MINLRNLAGAVDVGTLPVALTHVRTLEGFDGPLLAEFKSDNGEGYLYHWCDRDMDLSRWMVVRTPPQNIARYLVGVTTLRELVTKCHDGFVYLLDLDSDDRVKGTFFINVESLPEDYIPTEQSHYDATTLATEAQQDVFINDQSADKMWEVRRKYLQAYNFLALFGPHGNATELPEEKIRYTMRGGYVRYTLFAVLANYVLDDKRASLAKVAVASPGYVRFQVDPLVASDLRGALAHYLTNRETIDAAIKKLSNWANDQEPMSNRKARGMLEELCQGLGITSVDLLDHADVDVAIDALKSYVNRLAYFVQEERENTAMLVGLDRSSPTLR